MLALRIIERMGPTADLCQLFDPDQRIFRWIAHATCAPQSGQQEVAVTRSPGAPVACDRLATGESPGRCRRSTELSTRGGDSRADAQTTADTLQSASGGLSVDRRLGLKRILVAIDGSRAADNAQSVEKLPAGVGWRQYGVIAAAIMTNQISRAAELVFKRHCETRHSAAR